MHLVTFYPYRSMKPAHQALEGTLFASGTLVYKIFLPDRNEFLPYGWHRFGRSARSSSVLSLYVSPPRHSRSKAWTAWEGLFSSKSLRGKWKSRFRFLLYWYWKLGARHWLHPNHIFPSCMISAHESCQLDFGSCSDPWFWRSHGWRESEKRWSRPWWRQRRLQDKAKKRPRSSRLSRRGLCHDSDSRSCEWLLSLSWWLKGIERCLIQVAAWALIGSFELQRSGC